MGATDHSQSVGSIYSERAAQYDNSHHGALAKDFVTWANLKAGSSVLDLAAGTGLVTILAKHAVGENGRVVGVDLSEGMLDEAKRKSKEEQLSIDWLLGDIADMDKNSTLYKDISALAPEQGFDTITCCSALILLQDPAKAIDQWTELLAPGGQMIIDTPHNTKTIAPQILFQLYDEELLSSFLLAKLEHRLPGEAQLRKWLQFSELRAESWVSATYLQKEISLKNANKYWEEISQSTSWDMKIKDGVDSERVKTRFIEILKSMNPGANKLTEDIQIIVARGWKRK